MKFKLIVFRKKSLVWLNGQCWTQNYSVSSKLRIHSKYFFKVLHIDKGQEAHENHILI